MFKMINKSEDEIMTSWEDNFNYPIVSICCITYNHEDYIAEALNSFLFQKTTFPFEIIIRDDASLDNTANIIREYEIKYPNIIKPIYEKENGYKKGIRASSIVYEKANGKYISLCEGDDYWIDELKLQKSYEKLKLNPSSKFLFTPALQVENNKKDKIRNQYTKEAIDKIDLDWVIKAGGGFYPTASSFFEAKIVKEAPDWFTKHVTGDYPLAILFILQGKLTYLDDVTTVYRSQPNSVSHRKESNEKIEQKCDTNIKFFKMLKESNIINKNSEKYMIKKEIYIKCVKTNSISLEDITKIGMFNTIKYFLKKFI